MDTTTIQLEISRIIARIIEVDISKIGPDTKFNEIGADSMMMLEILVAIEKKYMIEIPESELPNMNTVDAIAKLVVDGSEGKNAQE